MQPIEHIYITSHRDDFWMAKICVASVRYWYPEIEVTLILDKSRGEFPGREILETDEKWQTNHFFVPDAWSGPWSKLNAFWARPGERFFVIDADTVLLGPLLETLQAFPEDFVVDWPGKLLQEERIEAFAVEGYLSTKLVQAQFPDYVPPRFFFNTGQIVGRGGIIQPEDISPFIIPGTYPTKSRYPDLFRWNDQGVLNFVLAEKARAGVCTIRPFSFMKWGFNPDRDKWKLKKIRRRNGIPYILHWAGWKLPFKSYLPHNDILNFFEVYYYRRLRWGFVRRWIHLWRRIRGFNPKHTHEKMRQTDNRPFLRTRILAAELWPRVRSHFYKPAKKVENK
jgi:hypothetical protein